jgi:hypothetical protein
MPDKGTLNEMPNDHLDRSERFQAILHDLIKTADSFLQSTKEHEIAGTDGWRDLSRATYEAASDASNLRSLT